MSRLGTPYNDILAQQAQSLVLQQGAGASSYFSDPTDDLDPRLFAPGTDVLLPPVRAWILDRIYRFWSAHYAHPQWWSTVWIAGSGITHQWSAGREVSGPGDLDVLVGVDWQTFFQSNPDRRGQSDDAMAAFMNEELHQQLWPSCANAVLPGGGAPFEVTFYVNPTATDIRTINPYAAYNVTTNTWTVRPPVLGAHPNLDVPADWMDKVNFEAGRARELGDRFVALRERLRVNTDPAAQINALTAMHEVLGTAGQLFSQIHSRRKIAFSPGGEGYRDFNNWSWQFLKQQGASQQLHQLAALDADVHADSVGQCYSRGLLDPQHALMLAIKVVGT